MTGKVPRQVLWSIPKEQSVQVENEWTSPDGWLHNKIIGTDRLPEKNDLGDNGTERLLWKISKRFK